MPAPKAQEGEDPDPTPYLFVSLEQKRIDQTKPYDAKKACWVPDEKEGYLLGEIKATKGDVVSVGLPGGEVCIRHPLCTLLLSLDEAITRIARRSMADEYSR
jgi:hypothetical protein